MFTAKPSLGNKGADILTFSFYLALVLIGWLMIYTTGAGMDGYAEHSLATFLFETEVGKQTLWIPICLSVFFSIFLFLDHKIWSVFGYPIYVVTILLLIGVLIFGVEIKGATSWFRFAGFTLQPSELAKFGTCLGMATYLNSWSNRMDQPRTILIGFALWILPMLLILKQPDAGSALVFTSFLIVMYREGLTPLLHILGVFTTMMLILGIVVESTVILVGAICLAGLLFYALYAPRAQWQLLLGLVMIGGMAFYGFREGWGWYVPLALGILLLVGSAYYYLRRRFRIANLVIMGVIVGSVMAMASSYFFNNVLQPHQQERIKVWLLPEQANPLGPRYNVLQSQLAIAAGGPTGKGVLEGTMTKFGYVPEQQTDFIFCAVGEEHGFVGTTAVILLFLALLWRITIIAERQRSTFNRAYAYGVAGILFVHLVVNVGMTMGLLPVIGIPLPFMSKGGSSLLGFTIMLAVLLKLDKYRDEV